jgi:hypothetical protein
MAGGVARGTQGGDRGSAPSSVRSGRRDAFDGTAGAVWAPGEQPQVVFGFTIEGGRIVARDLHVDPEHLQRLALAILDE